MLKKIYKNNLLKKFFDYEIPTQNLPQSFLCRGHISMIFVDFNPLKDSHVSEDHMETKELSLSLKAKKL